MRRRWPSSCSSADEQTAREALQALAHIGSTKAAGIVGVHLRRGASSVRAAAEEALRHFPPAAAARRCAICLASREFILQHPQIAVRLLDRAEQAGLTDLQPAMRALVPLRFRFWNPAVVRVGAQGPDDDRSTMTKRVSALPAGRPASPPDPMHVLKGFASLRRLMGTYPTGHPMIAQKLKELDDLIRHPPAPRPGCSKSTSSTATCHLDGVSFGRDQQANAQADPRAVGPGHRQHPHPRGRRDRRAPRRRGVPVAATRTARDGEPMEAQLARRGVRHISLAQARAARHAVARAAVARRADRSASIRPTRNRWCSRSRPSSTVASGRQLDPVTVRDLVQLLIYRVARSNAALGQILAVKQYENLTYCHSVNVAMLSLLIGKQIGLNERRSPRWSRRRSCTTSARRAFRSTS